MPVSKKYIGATIRVAVGLFLVWLVFRETDWRAVAASLGSLDPTSLLLAVGLVFGAQLARVQRWSYIVRAAATARFRSVFSAAQIGLLANVALPMRVGDVVRAMVLARLTRLPVAQGLVLVALDRVSDVAGLLAVFCVVLVSFPADQSVEIAGGVFGGSEPLRFSSAAIRPIVLAVTALVAASVVALALLYTNATRLVRVSDLLLRPLPERVRRRVRRSLLDLAGGMHVLRSPPDIAKTLGFSLLAWSCGVLSLSALIVAFGIPFSWGTPFLMQAMIAVFVIAPMAPGLIGQYHLPIVACLLMTTPGLPVAEAKAFALVAHLVAIVPIAALGTASLIVERLSLAELISRPRTGAP